MDNPNNNFVQVHCWGSLARYLISNEHSATIFGISSRGIFLKFNNDKMLFLSYEKYRGPLTANLTGDIKLLSICSIGEIIKVSSDELLFSTSEIRVSTSNAEIWSPPLPKNPHLKPMDRKKVIEKLISDVIQQKNNGVQSDLLPVLTEHHSKNSLKNNQLWKLIENSEIIRNHISQCNLPPLFDITQLFLGLGGGLTPSGDDFVIGLLLSLNRWGAILHNCINLSIYNNQVVEAAYQHTTTISANLIECAALGLADERLIQAVDFLATGNGYRSEILRGLLDWGSTSGLDALAGMITAFTLV